MDAAPRVSVIVRTKDRPGLLAEALESLRRQTFDDFEVVLVNDGGVPPSRDVLEPHPGRGLRLIATEPPQGRSRALNVGLEGAAGRYIAYLDDDDLYYPDHLSTLAGFLDGSDEYRAAYTDVAQIEQGLGEDGRYHDGKKLPGYGQNFQPGRLVSSNFVPIIALMHHRALAAQAGFYDESFDLFEDWDFLIRLSRLTRFHRIPRVTAVYRVRNDGSNATTETAWMTERSQAARRHVFEKHWNLRTPETEMALVDSFQSEVGGLAAQVETLREKLADAEAQARSNAAAAENLEGELHAFRADAARQIQASGERESELKAHMAALSGTVDQMNRSLAWRLFAPYRKLKNLLKG